MARTISKKNTTFRSEREFMFVIWTKVGPTSTTKNSKGLIVGCNLEKFFCGGLKIEDFGRKHVYKKSGCDKSIIPILERHGSIGK
jgi:hypothetical protein